MPAFPTASAVAALALVTVFAAITPGAAMAQAAGATTTTPSGLKITDSKVGTGATPKCQGQEVR
jgi:peptidylprolyl isomerase